MVLSYSYRWVIDGYQSYAILVAIEARSKKQNKEVKADYTTKQIHKGKPGILKKGGKQAKE